MSRTFWRTAPARRRVPDRRKPTQPESVVTVRELHQHLEPLDDRFLQIERRFARIEVGLGVLAAAVASPKLGGPTVNATTALELGKTIAHTALAVTSIFF